MKHSHIAGMALLTGLLAGCADNAPYQDSNSKAEEYMHQFIKDFGVPVPGHDFSMATSSGLQVKASKPTNIIVTAEIDGEEYEFARLSVPAGTTPLPVTVPKSVSELNIYLGLAKYTVGVNEAVDLDRLASSPASRGYTYDGVEIKLSGNGTGKPVIAFKYGDFLDAYFKANPVGTDRDNTMSLMNDENGNKVSVISEYFTPSMDKLLFCETCIVDYPNPYITAAEYDIFPIYWHQTADGKDYSVQLSSRFDATKKWSVDFGGTNDNPFPGIKYATVTDPLTSEIFNNLAGFNTGSATEAYSLDNAAADMVIVSEGIRVTIPQQNSSEGFSIDLVTKKDGKDLVSSSNPYINHQLWNGAYYDTSISNLATCRGASKRTFLDKAILGNAKGGVNRLDPDRAFDALMVKNPNGDIEYRQAAIMPFLLGFSSPAKVAGDNTKRDYANALFLVVPVTKYKVTSDADEYYNIGLGEVYTNGLRKFYWTIAAEDLGGSFDWDFNDAVFAFSDRITNLNIENVFSTKTQLWGPQDAVAVRSIEVVPMAAGGTMPLYITYTGKLYDTENSLLTTPSESDEKYSTVNGNLKKAKEDATVVEGTWILGAEIHKWLGCGDAYGTQFNTGANRVHVSTADKIVKFNIPTDAKLGEAISAYPISKNNETMMGFAVLVDKDSELQIDTKQENGKYSFVAQPELTLGTGTYVIAGLNQDKGNIAPQMILVQNAIYSPGVDDEDIVPPYTNKEPDWMNLEWEWPSEWMSLAEAYPDFIKWVTEDSTLDWTKNKDPEKVTKR